MNTPSRRYAGNGAICTPTPARIVLPVAISCSVSRNTPLCPGGSPAQPDAEGPLFDVPNVQQEDSMKHYSLRRGLAATAGLAMTLVAALGPQASAASAAGPGDGRSGATLISLVSVVCPGSDNATFSPGLRNFSQTVSFTETLEGHSCGGIGKISGDDSFTTSFAGTQELSCTELHIPPSYTLVFTWSPSGRTSTWNATLTQVTYASGQVIATSTGQITAGDYTGVTLTAISVYPTAQLLACLSSPGLTSISGIVTWTFTDL